MKLARIGGLLLLATALASGETTIDSVVRQATRLRGVGQTGRADRRSVDRVRMLRSALLRWIEGELPVGGEHPEATALAGRLNSALSGAGLIAARGEDGRLGFVTPVKVTGPAGKMRRCPCIDSARAVGYGLWKIYRQATGTRMWVRL
ncbi:MAG: hypothetical protein NTY38_25725 [Acidobacteria bacterium]|nr:hypothetical protein [Acidobacteriota bacterium]